jgi:hypothetical protein
MDEIELPDGRSVPAAAVAALDELEKSWPGATLPQARAAIVAAVIDAIVQGVIDEDEDRLQGELGARPGLTESILTYWRTT